MWIKVGKGIGKIVLYDEVGRGWYVIFLVFMLFVLKGYVFKENC